MMRLSLIWIAIAGSLLCARQGCGQADTGSVDGPMKIPATVGQPREVPAGQAPNATATNANSEKPAVADAAGVYTQGAGLVLPRLVNPVPIDYPENAPVAEPPRNCTLSVIVGADGTPSQIHVVRSLVTEVDQAIIHALSEIHFEPGTLEGKPVPVRVDVLLHFRAMGGSAMPIVRPAGRAGNQMRTNSFDTPPHATHMKDAEFSEEARRAKFSGSVFVELTVTEEGLPTDVHVTRPLGKGLDEKAVEAVRQYRFRPAMKDGKPVAAIINVEVSFRIYSRQ